MLITPDSKDWTWVIDRPCAECGFDASSVPPEQVGELLRTNAAAWQSILAGPPEALRLRTRVDRWSPLEYSCHVRDVFRLFHTRLELMLTTDDPLYPNWDQDETAVRERYNEQDPAAVATQLTEAAAVVASEFEAVEGVGWDRRGSRSDGAKFTVASFARYLIHDPIHHLHDVTIDLQNR